MGPLKKNEIFMIGVFLLILVLWIFGSNININATTTAFIGLGSLLVTQVLTWSDIKKEEGAWDTLIWFAVLVMMANFLNELGRIPWFSETMQGAVSSMSGIWTLAILSVVYFYFGGAWWKLLGLW